MRNLSLAFAALASACAVHAAAEFQYYVFPVGTITGLAQPAQAAQGSRTSAMIEADYAAKFFPPPVEKSLIDTFRGEVAKRFPGAVVGANQIQSARSGKYVHEPFEQAQCKPQFTASYKDAFAIAVGVSRLSVYTNRYGNFADVLVPVTYTLRFVKLNGADVVFSRSETIYTTYTGLASDVFEPGSDRVAAGVVNKLQSAVLDDGLKVVQRQVESAARTFTPKVTQVAVSAKDGDYFVFGNGSEAGFSSNEEFDAVDDNGRELSFTVLYATTGAAVAVASDFTPEVKRTTNSVRAGEKLHFTFTKQGRDDAKPSVLAHEYFPTPGEKLSDAQVRSNALMAIAADDIGFKAPFNLVKHDADFALLKDQIRAEANCDSAMFRQIHGFADNTTLPRPVPDYFLKLETYASPVFTSWGVGRVNSRSVFSNAVSLSLVDRSGVVRQAFLGNAPYDLQRSGDRGLSFAQASEVNRKNAALSALKSLIEGFDGHRRTIPVQKAAANEITLAQPISPQMVAQARLVRPVRAGGRELLMPLPADTAQLIAPAQATQRIAIRGQVRPGDQLLLGSFDPGQRSLRRCDAARQGRFIATPFKFASGVEPAVAAVVATGAKGFTVFESDAAFTRSVKAVLTDGHFDSWEQPEPPSDAQCYLPMELQQPVKSECNADLCSGTANVASGLRIFNGDAKVAESINGARVEFKDIPASDLAEFVGVKAYEQQINSIPTHRSKFN
jgi:hypothetical protein